MVCHQTSVGVLPLAAFSAPHQRRRHVGDAVHRVEVEGVVGRVLRVPEDGVVLGGPTPLRPAAIVVGPDDLVDEARPAEDAVQHHLAVVRLAVIDMEEERARVGEHPMGLVQARLEEGQVVVEAIPITGLAERGRPIALALEGRSCPPAASLLRPEGHPRLGCGPVLKGGSI